MRASAVARSQDRVARHDPPSRTGRRGGRVLNVGACLAAYLYGSMPFVYLLARQRRVDLRRVGSGSIGATNLWIASGNWRPALGWIGDASKGFLPFPIARRMGCSRNVAELAGVCGVAGQCWPVFLGFNGSWGISAFVGAALWINPAAWTVSLLPMIGGVLWRVVPRLGQRYHRVRRRLRTTRSKSVPLGCLVGVTSFPVSCRALARPGRALTSTPVLLALLILLRRLTALLPDDATRGPWVRPEALWYRLLYDRNTGQ